MPPTRRSCGRRARSACAASAPCTGAQPSPIAATTRPAAGKGLKLQWKSIIEQQPDWVEIVTWNDFSESYICPVALSNSPGSGRSPDAVPPYLKSRSSHAGYLEVSRYYIEWYKTGKQPPLTDALFYFYRVHPKDAVAKEDRPVKTFHGPVQDVLYVTTMMTVPAELQVTSGGTKTTHRSSRGFSISVSLSSAAHSTLPYTATARPFFPKTASRLRIGSSSTTTSPRAGLPTPGRTTNDKERARAISSSGDSTRWTPGSRSRTSLPPSHAVNPGKVVDFAAECRDNDRLMPRSCLTCRPLPPPTPDAE